MFTDNTFRRVMNCIPIPIIILDESNNIVYHNRKSEIWLRYTHIRVKNNQISSLLDNLLIEDDINRCYAALDKVKEAIKQNSNITIRLEVTTKDLNKAYYIVLTTASNITLDDQNFILVTLEDITHLKERERQIQESQAILTTVINNTASIMYDNIKQMNASTSRLQQQTNSIKQQINI